jgi:hypothetical protein
MLRRQDIFTAENTESTHLPWRAMPGEIFKGFSL